MSVTTRVTSNPPSAKHAALAANGNANPTLNMNAPIGGPSSWLVRRNELVRRALPTPRSSRLTTRGRRLLLATSAKISAVPRTNRASSTTAMLTDTADDRPCQDRQHGRPGKVHAGDDVTAVEAVGDGTRRDAEEQVRELLAQQRHRHQEWVTGLGGDQERTGGERDPVTNIGDDGGREEPAKARAEAGWCDRLDGEARVERHRPEDSNGDAGRRA